MMKDTSSGAPKQGTMENGCSCTGKNMWAVFLGQDRLKTGPENEHRAGGMGRSTWASCWAGDGGTGRGAS